MTNEIIAGIFALAGALAGGIFTLAATRSDQKWQRAKAQIRTLAGQVAAYHKLEELYKAELATLDPSGRKAKAVQSQMRDQVAKTDGFERPTMTATEARAILRRWE